MKIDKKNAVKSYAREIGVSMAESQFDVGDIASSYEDVCKMMFGENPSLTKEEWEFEVRDAFSWRKAELEDHPSEKKRMKIVLATIEAINAFANIMAKEKDEYTLQNEKGDISVSAKSALGLAYMTMDVGNTFFLVNDTHNGTFPDMLTTDGYHQF